MVIFIIIFVSLIVLFYILLASGIVWVCGCTKTLEVLSPTKQVMISYTELMYGNNKSLPFKFGVKKYIEETR